MPELGGGDASRDYSKKHWPARFTAAGLMPCKLSQLKKRLSDPCGASQGKPLPPGLPPPPWLPPLPGAPPPRPVCLSRHPRVPARTSSEVFLAPQAQVRALKIPFQLPVSSELIAVLIWHFRVRLLAECHFPPLDCEVPKRPGPSWSPPGPQHRPSTE